MENITVLLLLILIALILILTFVCFCHVRLKEINDTLRTIFEWENKEQNGVGSMVLDPTNMFHGNNKFKLGYEDVAPIIRTARIQRENENKRIYEWAESVGTKE